MTSTSKLLKDINREYAIYVAMSRAIPSIEDGLKFGQRMALWLMRNRAEKMKTTALSGLMSYERLYVHGQAASENAIGLLAAPYRNTAPLLTGLGAFGSRVSPVDGIGAPRYTEVQRSAVAQQILYRDLDLVPMEDNYDGSNQQPIHFLPLIPTVLLNGVEGVAVGYSTSIFPRSLKNIIEATQAAIEGKPLPEMPPYYHLYDLKIKHIAAQQWEFTGRIEIVDTSTVRIKELPPGLSIENFRKFLIDLEERNEIMSFADNSTSSIDITVKFKRGSLGATVARVEEEIIDGKKIKTKISARAAWKEADVIKFFKLTEKSSERITVVDWGRGGIATYPNPQEVVKSFVQWRLAWYTRRYEKLIRDNSEELVYWKLLKLLFKSGFTKKLGTFPDRDGMNIEVSGVALKAKLTVDDAVIARAVSLPTYRWTQDFEVEVDNKIKELTDAIAENQSTLKSPERLKAVYLSEVNELKRKL